MDATATEPKTPVPADPAAATAATGELPPATADGEKKEGEGEGAGDEDEDKVKPLYEKYDWFDPRKFTPICTLSIKLIQP